MRIRLAVILFLVVTQGAYAQTTISKQEIKERMRYEPEGTKTGMENAKKHGGTYGKKTYAYCIRRGLAQGYTQPMLGQWCTQHGFNN